MIHHGGRDGSRPRGSTALEAAADVVVKVARGEGEGPHTATVEMAKDDASGDAMPFALRMVDLPPDRHGRPRATCLAVEADDGGAPGRAGPSLSGQQRTALGYLHDAIAEAGEPLPTAWRLPAGLRGVRFERWREECDRRRLSTSDSPKNRNDVFHRVAGALRDRGVTAMRDDWVWAIATRPARDKARPGCDRAATDTPGEALATSDQRPAPLGAVAGRGRAAPGAPIAETPVPDDGGEGEPEPWAGAEGQNPDNQTPPATGDDAAAHWQAYWRQAETRHRSDGLAPPEARSAADRDTLAAYRVAHPGTARDQAATALSALLGFRL